MKKNTFFYLLFFCFIFSANFAFAKSPVWKVSKDGHHLFIGGTLHLLTPSDYPLPPSFDAAYKNSKLLVLETDLQKFNSPEVQQELLRRALYTGDQKLTDFLKSETVQSLESYLASRGIPLQSVLKFKVGMLSMTLTVLELERLGMVGTGVDAYYGLRALNENRKVGYLETAYEQINYLSRMGEGNENKFMEYTLNDLKSLPQQLDSIKKAWKNGDTALLEKVALDSWVYLFPEVYELLVLDRNKNWVPKIQQMLATKEVELVLFGALHLAGDDGILAQLEKLGCKIENL